jgi:hypothetical protein
MLAADHPVLRHPRLSGNRRCRNGVFPGTRHGDSARRHIAKPIQPRHLRRTQISRPRGIILQSIIRDKFQPHVNTGADRFIVLALRERLIALTRAGQLLRDDQGYRLAHTNSALTAGSY